MGDDYLASGFRDVDRAGEGDVYAACLALLDGLPYYRHSKRRSYALMGLAAGQRVLDAGCGLGQDVFRMAARVGATGQVIGLDASTTLLARATADPRSRQLPAAFCTGDLRALPFADGRFDRCRIDRVLQHVARPGAVIAELRRVLAPGGILLAYDNDWGTFAVTADDAALTQRIQGHWSNAFANPWIGRQLHELLHEAGFGRIERHPSVSVIDDLDTADRVYNLRQTVARAAAAGEITQAEGRGWLAGLERRARRGCFAVALTAYTVVGHRGP